MDAVAGYDTTLLEERQAIAWRVLEFLRANPWSTIPEVASGLGVSKQAIHKHLPRGDKEDGPSGDPIAKGSGAEPEQLGDLGRLLDFYDDGRARRFALPEKAGRLLVLDLGARHYRVALCNLRQDPLDDPLENAEPVDLFSEPRLALEQAANQARELLSKNDVQLSHIVGVAVGVPFPVGEKVRAQTPPNWRGVELPRSFLLQLGLDASAFESALLESDAGLGALAELQAAERRAKRQRGKHRALPRTMLYVKWSSSVAASVIVDGRLHKSEGLAGSFVHNPVDSPPKLTPLCAICERHCTIMEAGLRHVITDLEALSIDGVSVEVVGDDTEQRAARVVELAREHRQVRERLDGAGRALGRAIGHAANVLAPDLVVIGGAFRSDETTNTYDAVCDSLQEGLDQVAIPKVAEELRMISGAYTGRAAVVGGMALAAREFAVPFLYTTYKAAKTKKKRIQKARASGSRSETFRRG